MKHLLVRHLAVWLVGGVLFRVGLVPPETCPVVTPDEVRAAAAAAGDWLERNLDTNGRFVYGYDRASDTVNPDYSIVRHAGAMNTLYQLAAAGQTRFQPVADQALDYLLERRIDHDDWTMIAEPGRRARIGTVGFLVVDWRNAGRSPAHRIMTI